MVGKKVQKEEIANAISVYLADTAKHPGMESTYDDEADTYLLKDANGKEVTIGPGWSCSDDSLKQELADIMMAARDAKDTETPKSSGMAVSQIKDNNIPVSTIKCQERASGQSVENWRANQDRTYNVQGKTVPNAFGTSEEANRRGLCTRIIDSGRTKDLVWGHVRITDPATGQYREDRVSHERETFLLLKSWEDANAQLKWQKAGQPSLLIGIQDNNMPQLNPDVKIKGMPAPLWLTMQILRAWSFADRDAITKAERRAQLKILNREWREKDEITLEDEEERAVREAA